MWTTYEWDIETTERLNDGDEEILDHHHAERLNDFPKGALTAENEPYEYNTLVLVRDSDGERLWAYVDPTNSTLPRYFCDSWQEEIDVKVPKRFHEELTRWCKLKRR